uniref:Transposase n=1 Tax=Macrostomum lignano TaxID=282301 RepID=A0A1I8F7K3_9PLAT
PTAYYRAKSAGNSPHNTAWPTHTMTGRRRPNLDTQPIALHEPIRRAKNEVSTRHRPPCRPNNRADVVARTDHRLHLGWDTELKRKPDGVAKRRKKLVLLASRAATMEAPCVWGALRMEGVHLKNASYAATD